MPALSDAIILEKKANTPDEDVLTQQMLERIQIQERQLMIFSTLTRALATIVMRGAEATDDQLLVFDATQLMRATEVTLEIIETEDDQVALAVGNWREDDGEAEEAQADDAGGDS